MTFIEFILFYFIIIFYGFYRTNTVKVSKLHLLIAKFESIRMEEHETFGEFHTKLMDIVNSRFNLGEPIPNSKVMRKF